MNASRSNLIWTFVVYVAGVPFLAVIHLVLCVALTVYAATEGSTFAYALSRLLSAPGTLFMPWLYPNLVELPPGAMSYANSLLWGALLTFAGRWVAMRLELRISPKAA